MMKYLLLLCIIVLVVSCKKDPKLRTPDKILYTDLADDTIRNVTGGDTLIIRQLDVNADNTPDFVITLRASACSYVPIGGSPCDQTTEIQIHSDNRGKNKALCYKRVRENNIPQILPAIQFYHTGDYIHLFTGSETFERILIYGNDYDYLSWSNSGEGYIGFYIDQKYFGWIKIEAFGYQSAQIVIKEAAVNLTEGNAIVAGQKQ